MGSYPKDRIDGMHDTIAEAKIFTDCICQVFHLFSAS
jgi:hypothetical protein